MHCVFFLFFCFCFCLDCSFELYQTSQSKPLNLKVEVEETLGERAGDVEDEDGEVAEVTLEEGEVEDMVGLEAEGDDEPVGSMDSLVESSAKDSSFSNMPAK